MLPRMTPGGNGLPSPKRFPLMKSATVLQELERETRRLPVAPTKYISPASTLSLVGLNPPNLRSCLLRSGARWHSRRWQSSTADDQHSRGKPLLDGSAATAEEAGNADNGGTKVKRRECESEARERANPKSRQQQQSYHYRRRYCHFKKEGRKSRLHVESAHEKDPAD